MYTTSGSARPITRPMQWPRFSLTAVFLLFCGFIGRSHAQTIGYSANPAIYTTGILIAPNTPSSTTVGCAKGYGVAPTLPAGLSLNGGTGFITGTPTIPVAMAKYTVTANNICNKTGRVGTGGNFLEVLTITVSQGPAPAPLSAGNINLIFVVSEDLAYNAAADVNTNTANLTNQGLQRALSMGSFLQTNILGGNNVSGIYTLEPMTHLQTANSYPDMVGLETIQQFALLNPITLSPYPGNAPQSTGNSFPLDASYSPGAIPGAVGPTPSNVAPPLIYCPGCQGLDFNNQGNDNETLATDILKSNVPGFYVFSAPWELTQSLLANINSAKHYNLNLPGSYQGPNYIYAVSVTPAGSASLVTYNSSVPPASVYPTPQPEPPPTSTCTGGQTPFNFAVTGTKIPQGINTNETVYMIRHAEAHPTNWWDDGNYIGAGQWRALDLPNKLAKVLTHKVTQVYSIDPAQELPSGNSNWSYVRPSLTVEPYAVANNLPFNLVTNFELLATNSPELTSNFFFEGGTFSGQTVLLAWEHDHIPPTVSWLISTYGSTQTVSLWPGGDYDTIWTVTLDGSGNLTVNNRLCEGINSATLPATAPVAFSQ